MKLTNKKVEQLTTNTKSYIVWDTDVRGFGVRVNKIVFEDNEIIDFEE